MLPYRIEITDTEQLEKKDFYFSTQKQRINTCNHRISGRIPAIPSGGSVIILPPGCESIKMNYSTNPLVRIREIYPDPYRYNLDS
jgi:hypothetical protein